jgi:pimeloyl-ACP methyl ester carboxylesterase
MAQSGHVISSDGVRIAVYETGGPELPPVVCLHGYPDNANIWSGLTAELAGRYHVTSYDVRGAGDSDKPNDRSSFRLGQLQEDFRAVIDAVSPQRPVHLIAHDWGSIQAWHFSTAPELQSRIASFTSISGPSLAHTGHWVRQNLRPGAGPGSKAKVLKQFGHSYYLAAFQIPVLPELLWRSGLLERAVRVRDRSYRRSMADRIHGLQLYRANRLGAGGGGPGTSAADRTTAIPVQVLAPKADRFVTPALQLEAPRPFVEQLYLRLIAGDHWVVANQPSLIARAAVELIDWVEAGGEGSAPRSPGLEKARQAALGAGHSGDRGRRLDGG